MTLPSQFSLEEENFYKDIQDLVKNKSQNEKELSLFLQRYMDLLAKADLDDETFIINFTKAGLIIEASAKVYGTKVDKLWINLEHVLESLKNKNPSQSKKKLDCEDGDELDLDGGCDDEESKRKMLHSKKRKKMGDSLFSVDDFLEIDNISGLLEKNMNESTTNNKETNLKFCEKIPYMFIKNKRKKNKIDVCLNKVVDDKDIIRLRDWIVSADCLLIKEIYNPRPEKFIEPAQVSDGNKTKSDYFNEEPMDCDMGSTEETMKINENFKDEKNNNTEVVIRLNQSLSDEIPSKKNLSSEEINDIISEPNISKESDMTRFPQLRDLSLGCVVDVDEVFWNSSKFHDVIPSKKMRAGKTNKLPCQLCAHKKVHKKRGKRCTDEKKLESLDSYFTPHVYPAVSEPQFGILPDEDLYSVFKMEMKLIEQLGKVNACKNINEAYHPDESPEELKDFLGFDGFEHCLMKKTVDLQEDDISEYLRLDEVEDDNENYVDDPPLDNEFQLPFPITENSLVKTSIAVRAADLGSKEDEQFAQSESEYQKLVMEELKGHYAAKTSFAKNKELGLKISKWHEIIADKIALSQKRGALNMNSLAEKIMDAFPSIANNSKPEMPFKELVREQSRRDVPRYFFACLQLTNEGNIDISRSSAQPLVTDCMVITQLRPTRSNYELDESTVKSPCKEINPLKSSSQKNRKRNSLSRSPCLLENKTFNKNKKMKHEIVKSHKRPKNFSSVKNSKRRCSFSSGDSLLSD